MYLYLAVSDFPNSVTGFWELLLEHGRSVLLTDPRGSRSWNPGPFSLHLSLDIFSPGSTPPPHETINRP